MRSTYHVWGDHTLLYHQDGCLTFGVLATKPQHGGVDPWTFDCLPPVNELRPATEADFEHFRVNSKGYDLTPVPAK